MENKILTDENGNQFYPVTHARAVIDDNGNNLNNCLTSIPQDYHKSYCFVVDAMENLSNVTCPVELLYTGEECTVIYTNNNSSEEDVFITVSTIYLTPTGDYLDVRCPFGGYCEINFLKVGNDIYARGG